MAKCKGGHDLPDFEDWKDHPHAPGWPLALAMQHEVFCGLMPVPATAKVLACVLAYRANENGHAVASIQTLSREAGCNPRTVIRALKQLTDAGVIRKIAGGYGRTASWYQLRLPE